MARIPGWVVHWKPGLSECLPHWTASKVTLDDDFKQTGAQEIGSRDWSGNNCDSNWSHRLQFPCRCHSTSPWILAFKEIINTQTPPQRSTTQVHQARGRINCSVKQTPTQCYHRANNTQCKHGTLKTGRREPHCVLFDSSSDLREEVETLFFFFWLSHHNPSHL